MSLLLTGAVLSDVPVHAPQKRKHFPYCRKSVKSIMTQLICYRSQMAPMEKKVSPEPEWVRRRPKARFPTIPPDVLQESTWSMIAKPVQSIMYHGWGTIYDMGSTIGYVYTNPESADRLKHLLKDVVAPLGPTLKRLGRAAPQVALLESFTTCALGGPSSRGGAGSCSR